MNIYLSKKYCRLLIIMILCLSGISLSYAAEGITTIDQTPPEVVSILRKTPATQTTTASAVTYTVTFSEDVQGVTPDDFTARIVSGTLVTGTITIAPGSASNNYDVTVPITSGYGTLNLDLNYTNTGITDASSNTILTGYNAGDAYIIKNNPVITFDDINRTLPVASFTLSSSSTGTGTPTYTILSQTPNDGTSAAMININSSDNTLNVFKAGTARIRVTYPEEAYFTTAIKDITLTVGKGTPAISFPNITRDYGSAAFSLMSTTTGNATAVYSIASQTPNDGTAAGMVSISGSTATISKAGTATLRVSYAETGNYLAASATATLTVNKISPTISFPSINKTYNDPPFTIVSTSTSNGTPTYSIATQNLNNGSLTGLMTISGNTVTIGNAGYGTVRATYPETDNYLAVSALTLVRISQAVQTITFDDITKTYGDADFELTATASSNLAVNYSIDNPAVATISLNKIRIVGAGETNITVKQLGNGNYFPAENVVKKLIVVKNIPVITFNELPQTKRYGDADFAAAITTSNTDNSAVLALSSSNESVVKIVNNKLHITGAGEADITASMASTGNFTAAASVTRHIKILKGIPVINFLTFESKKYGDSDFQPVALSNNTDPGALFSFSSNNELVATIVNGKIHIPGVGIATITASIAETTNFEAAQANQELVIDMSGKITAQPAIVTYTKMTTDTSSPISGTGEAGTVIEVYAGTQKNGETTVDAEGNWNYIFNPQLSEGIYEVTAVAADPSGNRSETSLPVFITIVVTRELTFGELPEKTYGDEDFAADIAVTGGSEAILSSANENVAQIINGKIHITGAGTTVITATVPTLEGAPAINKTRLLTVNKAAQVITFSSLPTLQRGSMPVTLAGSSTSNLDITYTIKDTLIAKAHSGQLIPLRIGTTIITATQPGNENYFPAEAVVNELRVEGPEGETLKASLTVTPNNDGVNDRWIIEGIDNYPDNEVVIMNRNGSVVYKANFYDNYERVFTGHKLTSSQPLPDGTYYYAVKYKDQGKAKQKSGYIIIRY